MRSIRGDHWNKFALPAKLVSTNSTLVVPPHFRGHGLVWERTGYSRGADQRL